MRNKILMIVLALVVLIPVWMNLMPTKPSTPQESTVEMTESKYQDKNNWAHFCEAPIYATDVFFVAPTNTSGDELNMDMNDQKAREAVLGAINMEKGLYDDEANFYSPYYRQVTLQCYELPVKERVPYLDLAYEDIKDAFEYYLENLNNGRAIILAGFSQGGDMVKRLLIDHPEIQDKLVVAYIIGWNVTQEDLDAHDYLKMAENEIDTGVIVSFCSESVELSDSIIVPETTIGINPLNWKTDSTKADKEENLGACFTNYAGEITKEVPQLTGAYLDEARGTLKVTDVKQEDYPARLSFLKEGNYHIYDYQFFYRNLEQNVQKRIENYYIQ